MRKLLSLPSPFLLMWSGLPWNVTQVRQKERKLRPRAGSLEKATLASDCKDSANLGGT